MDIFEAMQQRHAVRRFTDRRIDADTAAALQAETDACNLEGGLHIQLVLDEPNAFDGFLAHYGKFGGVKNYIALVGTKGPQLEETLGWYGERLVLRAQQLGLNTCWVAMSFSRGRARIAVDAGERLVCVIALGYGATQGTPHRSRPMSELCRTDGAMPDWFRRGMEAAMLAPTAVNQQKFRFTHMDGDRVQAAATGGFYDKVDLGIAKYHFETGAGRDSFRWA